MEAVNNEDFHTIETTCVLTKKIHASGKEIKKARLVARGFQDGMDETGEVYAPTCSKGTMRLLLSLCALKAWVPNVIDVTTAFLQGLPIERGVKLKPPKAAMENPNTVWKLKITVNGLAKAQKAWFETVKDFFSLDSWKTANKRASCVFQVQRQPAERICLHTRR